MWYKKSTILNRIFILFLILLCSCINTGKLKIPTPTYDIQIPPELMDKSWLTGQPCRAPCWFGLNLEKTTKIEAYEIIYKLHFIDIEYLKEIEAKNFDPIRHKEIEENEIFLYCLQPKQLVCTLLTFSEDRLIEISITPNFQVNIKEVVDNIGPPDYVMSSPISPEILQDCIIKFIWTNLQMEINFYDLEKYDMCKNFKDAENKPLPSLIITQVRYRLPEKFLNLTESRGYYPWTGFAEDK